MSQGEYEEENEEKIPMIPSVNDLLEQLLQNETSEDEIMHDQVGHSEFENSDEDEIIHEDALDISSVKGRPKSHRERNTGERLGEQNNTENETISRSTRPTKGIRPLRFREM